MRRINLLAATLLMVALGVEGQRSKDPSRYYLEMEDVADSQVLLPAKPDTLSARFAYDREQYEWGKSLRETERGRQAVIDADLSDGWIDRSFSEAFGMPITKDNLPEIYGLISTMKDDAGDLSTRGAKEYYKRVRPYVYFHEPSATPWDEKALSLNGSYPSGHTAIGWATALVLAEINPARVNESTTVRDSVLKPACISSNFAVKIGLWTKRNFTGRFFNPSRPYALEANNHVRFLPTVGIAELSKIKCVRY